MADGLVYLKLVERSGENCRIPGSGGRVPVKGPHGRKVGVVTTSGAVPVRLELKLRWLKRPPAKIMPPSLLDRINKAPDELFASTIKDCTMLDLTETVGLNSRSGIAQDPFSLIRCSRYLKVFLDITSPFISSCFFF
jgi:hypothetical protein